MNTSKTAALVVLAATLAGCDTSGPGKTVPPRPKHLASAQDSRWTVESVGRRGDRWVVACTARDGRRREVPVSPMMALHLQAGDICPAWS